MLISDLYEGGDNKEMLKRVGSILASGVRLSQWAAANNIVASRGDASD